MPGIANDLNINQLGIQSFNNTNGVFTGVTITAGSGISVANGNGQTGNPTISLAGGSVAIESITGDSGSITGNSVTIFSNNASLNGGSSVSFVNSGTISTLNVTDSLNNTIIGKSSGLNTMSGGLNTSLGYNNFVHITSGASNTAVGAASLIALTTGSRNAAIGYNNLPALTTGSNNLVVGIASGQAYTSSESSNLLIGHVGVISESNVLRIGTQGSGTQQQNTCFIAGITGVTTSSSNMVTINTSTGQLGAASIPTGTVTSVTGTPSQVAVANGTTTPVISLIGPYTPATYTAHGVLIGEGTSSIAALGAGSAGQVLQSGGASADPAYSTATYPATATSTGTILRADGTNWSATTSTYPNTNAVSTLLYASSANVMSALATANSGVLSTNSTGVPSIDTTNFAVLSTGLQLKGNNTNTVPPAGFIGERISSTATAVSMGLSTSVNNITSISLTAGIWDVSCIATGINSTVSANVLEAGISSASATFQGTIGDQIGYYFGTTSVWAQFTVSVPSFRVILSSTTIYYLVASMTFTGGTSTANGRISATRVG